MKCQILFSGENKKNISKCRLLKILPRVLSAKEIDPYQDCCLGMDSRLSYWVFIGTQFHFNMNLIGATYIRASKLSSHAS